MLAMGVLALKILRIHIEPMKWEMGYLGMVLVVLHPPNEKNKSFYCSEYKHLRKQQICMSVCTMCSANIRVFMQLVFLNVVIHQSVQLPDDPFLVLMVLRLSESSGFLLYC